LALKMLSVGNSSDLSVWQAQVLLPNGPGKALLFGKTGGKTGPCFACHNFQGRMVLAGYPGTNLVGIERQRRREVFLPRPQGSSEPAAKPASGLPAGGPRQGAGA